MRWWVHWGIQYALSNVFGGSVVHRLMQERGGQLRHLERGSQFQNALEIMDLAVRSAGDLAGRRVAEFGTGWVPAIPVALGLCGAEVHTFDVSALTKPDYFRRTLNTWQPRLADLASAAQQPVEMVTRRWERLSKAEDLSEFCRLTGGCYRAPCDTTRLPEATGFFDMVVSNLVLQAIPGELVIPVLRESSRLLKPSGWSFHRIRMTDEYAFSDPHRHDLHYLTYCQTTWDRWFNHRLKCQNRWRASQFMKAFEEVGLESHSVQRYRDPENVNYFRNVPLAPEFQHLDADDLATVGLFVGLCKRSPQATSSSTQAPLTIPESMSPETWKAS